MMALEFLGSFTSYMIYGCIVMFIGMIVGQHLANSAWLEHGKEDKRFRTAYHCRGEFYYVVPEREYVNRIVEDHARDKS